MIMSVVVQICVFIFISGSSCLAFPRNSPPVFDVKRDWFIPENEPVGSRVITVRTRDDDRDNITYGLEKSPYLIEGFNYDGSPYFSIHQRSGDVFLQKSFVGQSGKQFMVRVTANDGHQVSKVEVRVEVTQGIDKDEAVLVSSAGDPFAFMSPSFPSAFPYPRPKIPSTNNWSSNVANKPPFISSSSKTSDFIPTAIPLPPLRPPTTEEPDNFIPEVNETVRTKPRTTHNGHSSDMIGSPHSILYAIIIPLSVIIIAIIAAVSFCLNLYCKNQHAKLIKSISHKTPLDFESSRETSISSTYSADSRIEFFNSLKYSKKTTSLLNRYEGSELISSPFSVRENGSDEWEFPRKSLLFSRILGEGNFGQVWLCDAIDTCGDSKRQTVAVKMLKQIHSDKEKRDLLAELAIMKMLGHHPNVVNFLGCCSTHEPVYLIMEHVPNGKLQTYLRSCRSQAGYSCILTAQDLTSFAYQIAKGMEYIASKGIIHRDLAARNVLLGADKTCKIADFGFARDVMSCANQSYERKSEGPLPIRWMAPESLVDHVYTTKSDVWSFGILLWEIVTLGWTPYPGMDPQSIAKQVPQGYRMEKPVHCRRELFHVMHYCWHESPEERLTFTQVKDMLGSMLESDTDYIQLDQFPDRNYYNVVTTAFQERI